MLFKVAEIQTHRHRVAVSNGNDAVAIASRHLSLELFDVGTCPDFCRADLLNSFKTCLLKYIQKLNKQN